MAQTQIFKGTARNIVNDEMGKRFFYHSTAVLTLTPSHIVLRSGGWDTNTTRLAINQASSQEGLGIRVFKKNGQTFVSYRGATVPFFDGITFYR